MNEYNSSMYDRELRLIERRIYQYELQLEKDNIEVRISDTDNITRSDPSNFTQHLAIITQNVNNVPLAQCTITCEVTEGQTLGEHFLLRAKREFGMNFFDAATTRPFRRLMRRYGTVVYFSDVVINDPDIELESTAMQDVTQYILLLCCSRFKYADYFYANCDPRLIESYVGITLPFNEIIHSPLNWHLNPDRGANKSVLFGITRSDIIAFLDLG